jgi:hypothetical protein
MPEALLHFRRRSHPRYVLLSSVVVVSDSIAGDRSAYHSQSRRGEIGCGKGYYRQLPSTLLAAITFGRERKRTARLSDGEVRPGGNGSTIP